MTELRLQIIKLLSEQGLSTSLSKIGDQINFSFVNTIAYYGTIDIESKQIRISTRGHSLNLNDSIRFTDGLIRIIEVCKKIEGMLNATARV